LVFWYLLSVVYGHGWMTQPPPRVNPPNTNSNVPCENTTPSNGGIANPGVPFPVFWIHPHSGGNIIMRYTKTSTSASQTNFQIIKWNPFTQAWYRVDG